MRRRRWLLGVGVFLSGCHTDMWAQPQTRPLEPNAAFAFGQSARVAPQGTFAYSTDDKKGVFETGLLAGQPVEILPLVETERGLRLPNLRQVILRGKERFDVFCSPCHSRLGDGQGAISQRGFRLVRQPRSFHEPRIVNAPDGHIFRVITSGYGAMFSYGDRVPVADRWAIVAYIRALQLSQGAKEDFVGAR